MSWMSSEFLGVVIGPPRDLRCAARVVKWGRRGFGDQKSKCKKQNYSANIKMAGRVHRRDGHGGMSYGPEVAAKGWRLDEAALWLWAGASFAGRNLSPHPLSREGDCLFCESGVWLRQGRSKLSPNRRRFGTIFEAALGAADIGGGFAQRVLFGRWGG